MSECFLLFSYCLTFERFLFHCLKSECFVALLHWLMSVLLFRDWLMPECFQLLPRWLIFPMCSEAERSLALSAAEVDWGSGWTVPTKMRVTQI